MKSNQIKQIQTSKSNQMKLIQIDQNQRTPIKQKQTKLKIRQSQTKQWQKNNQNDVGSPQNRT
jgi:hypothetical protein